MTVPLTPRMKNWIEKFGVHAAVATRDRLPVVLVSYGCEVESDTVKIPLSRAQIGQVKDLFAEPPLVALGPGQLGSVRAPYQFKGKGALQNNNLVVKVSEIYCTRPGAEAGLRLDVLGYEKMKGFEEERWKDLKPPRA
ncbi:MAG: hypothetical protein GX334_05500 [Firmicutes bacterium]|nr:hypothetical protein [Bacillota bacterium]